MTTRRIGPGVYVIIDADGVEWDVSRRVDIDDDGNERQSGLWLAVDSQGGYVEAWTLREIKLALQA